MQIVPKQFQFNCTVSMWNYSAPDLEESLAAASAYSGRQIAKSLAASFVLQSITKPLNRHSVALYRPVRYIFNLRAASALFRYRPNVLGETSQHRPLYEFASQLQPIAANSPVSLSAAGR